MFDKERRMSMDFEEAWRATSHSECVCERCRDLNLPDLLAAYLPWTTQAQLTQAFNEGHELVRSLGNVGTAEFWNDCEVCRCLYALTPNPSSISQEMLLIPDWTVCRTAGETGITLDIAAKRHYATCLIVTLRPSSEGSTADLPTRAHRGDALSLLEEDVEQSRTLGGRRIKHGELDYNLIREWLSICTSRHGPACVPQFTPDLKHTYLVDVQSRQIVRHPGHGCEYVSLSYVWGEVKQSRYICGDHVEQLPQTIEDSINFTTNLGKQYLWVDSLCIDQEDHAHKDDQIQKMRDIYQGAYVTIIAISGDSASSGLPGISHRKIYQQMTCRVGGKRLVGLMPTLSQQVWLSPWGQRAWTFQESRLSPRCLIISDHQLYFECKGFSCIESLESGQSWFHNLSEQSNTTDGSFARFMMDQGGSGCFRHLPEERDAHLASHGYALNLYSARNLRYPGDYLKAFSGMLQTLHKVYPRGFMEGLPVEDLNWALLWTLRHPTTRQHDFPTWSWTGWNGPVCFGEPVHDQKPRRCPIDLEIETVSGGKLQRLFHLDMVSIENSAGPSIIIRNDPVDRAKHLPRGEMTWVLQYLPNELQNRALLIYGTHLHLSLDFSRPRHGQARSGMYGTFDISVNDVGCILQIMSTDKEVSATEGTAKTFMLLARDHLDKFIIHYLLLVYYQANGLVAERGTTLKLFVPMENLDILEVLKPIKRETLLV